MQRKRQPLTPVGVARILVRGVKENFVPQEHKQRLEELSEMLWDMACSLDTHAEYVGDLGLRLDADWLDAMADEIDNCIEPRDSKPPVEKLDPPSGVTEILVDSPGDPADRI